MSGGREPSEEEMADQRQEAEKEFDSLDKDADGKLTLEEVPPRRLLRALAGQPRPS